MTPRREKEKFRKARADLIKALGAKVTLAADAEALAKVHTRQELRAITQGLESGLAMLNKPFVSSHRVGFDSVPEIAISPHTGEIYFVGVERAAMANRPRVYKLGRFGAELLPGQSKRTVMIQNLHFPYGSCEPAWVATCCEDKERCIAFHWGETQIDIGSYSEIMFQPSLYHTGLCAIENQSGQRTVVDLNARHTSFIRRHEFDPESNSWSVNKLEVDGTINSALVVDGHLVFEVHDQKAPREMQLHWDAPDGTYHQVRFQGGYFQPGTFSVHQGTLQSLYIDKFLGSFRHTKIRPDGSLVQAQLKGQHKGSCEGQKIFSRNNRLFLVNSFDDNRTSVFDLKTGARFGGPRHMIHGEVVDILCTEDEVAILVSKPDDSFVNEVIYWPIEDGDSVAEGGREDPWIIDGFKDVQRLEYLGKQLAVVVHNDGRQPALMWKTDKAVPLHSTEEKLVWVESIGMAVAAHYALGTIYVRAYKPPQN